VSHGKLVLKACFSLDPSKSISGFLSRQFALKME
jgi:hypothetical protein